MPPRDFWTHESTLHRLRDVEPDTEAMFEAIGEERIDKLIERGADYSNTVVDGCPALVFFGQDTAHEPKWIREFRTTTGLSLPLLDQRSFALLMLAVDGEVYALGYGDGHHYIPSEYKDARFGLSFAARVADLLPWSLNLLEYDDGEETVINVESPRGAGFIPADSMRGKFFTGAAKAASGKSIALEDFLQ